MAAILLWITTAFALPGSFGAFSTWITNFSGDGSSSPYTETTIVTGWSAVTEPTPDRPPFATAAVGIPFTVGALLAAVACVMLLLARGRTADPVRARLLGMFAGALVAGTVLMVAADQCTQLFNHIVQSETASRSYSTELVLGTGFWLVVGAAAVAVSAIGLLAVPRPPAVPGPALPLRLAAVPLVLLAGLTIAGSLLPQVIREFGDSTDLSTVIVNSWATTELDAQGVVVPFEDVFPPYWLAAVLGALIAMVAAALALGARPVGARVLGVVGSGVALGYCSFELLSTAAGIGNLAARNEGVAAPEIYTVAAGTWVLISVAVLAIATAVLLIALGDRAGRRPRPVLSPGAPVHGDGVRAA